MLKLEHKVKHKFMPWPMIGVFIPFVIVRCDLCTGHVVPGPFASLLLLGAFAMFTQG
jgi:hypothetical protein